MEVFLMGYKRYLPLAGILISAALMLYLSVVDPGELSRYAPSLSFVFIVSLVGLFFLEYETSNLSSKEVALVGMMAATIAVARIPFAALPQIQPCTFLIIAVGLVFGSLSGMMCGALTAGVSNLFLGQGAWTPWQMLGWGLVGLIAGYVGSRYPDLDLRMIALLGVGASLFYGLLLDISSWIMFYEVDPARLVAVLSLGMPFNIAHAVGTVVFTFALGKPVLFYLRRFKMRFHVRYSGEAEALTS
ncbi:MAG: ECF transporter S component [Methanomassiliicoccales archaeon]